jgi:DNA-binding transcriptional ArsR family regulator
LASNGKSKSKSKGKARRATKAKGKSKARATGGVDQRLVKALAHELRVQVLTILNERMASPNELAKDLNEGLSQVSYHVKVLKDYDCIELVKTEPRRGAVEHYYKATSRPFLTDRDWKQLPDSVRPGMSADLVQMVIDDAAASLEEGTLDARQDRHMSRSPLILDQKGWEAVNEHFNADLGFVMKVQSESATRLAKSGDEGFPVTVAMMAFEVPPSRRTGKSAARKPARKGATRASKKTARKTRKRS